MARADDAPFNPHEWLDAHGGYIALTSSQREGNWCLVLPKGRTWPDVKSSLGNTDRRSRYFKNWADLAVYARTRLKVKGWSRQTINRMGFWRPDDTSKARPCEITVNHGDGRWSNFAPCGRVATGTGPGKWSSDGEVSQCNLHLAVVRRREERAEAWRVEREATNAQQTRVTQNKRAAQDYCDRLAAYRIKAVPAKVEGHYTGAVAIQGETVVKVIERLILLGHDLGISEPETIEDIAEPGFGRKTS